MYEIDDSEIRSLCLQHNFWTWSAQAHVDPIPVKKAKGVYFWDVDGKRYLDFNSMVMCVNIGHGDERVIEAICRQARELCFAGPKMATEPRAILGKMLTEITPPGIDHFLYTMGGADANENAVKLARDLYRAAYRAHLLPFLPRCDRWGHCAHRRSAPPALEHQLYARGRSFPEPIPLPFDLPPQQPGCV